MVYLLAFLLSFCSISYQFIIARVLGQFSNDEVLSQSITLGFYLVSMGIGSHWAGRLKVKNEERVLLILEAILAVIGVVLVPFLYMSHIFLAVFYSDLFSWLNEWSRNTDKVFIFQIFTLLVGFLTGMELPLLIRIQERRSSGSAFSRVLGVNYLGALLGSFVVALFLVPRLDLIRGSIFIALLNFVAALMVLIWQKNYWRRSAAAVLVCLLFFPVSYETLRYGELVQQAYMKTTYLETRMRELSWTSLKNLYLSMYAFNDVERYLTPYQIIDIVPQKFMKSGAIPGDFTLYLNMQPQFSRDTQRSYHESMADGAINLGGKIPRRVLILGAGDGLLAAELLKNKDIEQITLVELDPFMIELAREYIDIRELNHDSLDDPRVKVVIDDAFHFIRRTREKYDAVFVDFPFPVNYELGKLFSVEFYKSLRRVIQSDGFFVADIPVWRRIEVQGDLPKPYPQDIILSSLHAAGLDNFKIYGPFEPFIFVSMSAHPPHFDYMKLPDWIAEKTRVNLTGLPTLQQQADISTKNVNSIFKPQRFRW